MQGLSERQVASVRQWSLHELFADTKVLESIEEVATGKFNVQLLERVLLLRVEVESHVVKPSKVIDGLDLLLDQRLGDFSLMHKICDELLVLLTDVLVQVREDAISQELQNLQSSLVHDLKGHVATFVLEVLLNLLRPLDLHGEDVDLCRELLDPFGELLLLLLNVDQLLLLDGLEQLDGQADLHRVLDLGKPDIDGWILRDKDVLREAHVLALP